MGVANGKAGASVRVEDSPRGVKSCQMACAQKRKREPIDRGPKITRMREPTGTGDVSVGGGNLRPCSDAKHRANVFLPPVLEEVSGNGREVFSIWKNFAPAVDRNL